MHRAAGSGVIALLCGVMAGSAGAADLPRRDWAPPPEPVQIPAVVPQAEWSGLHVGADAGYARTGTQHLKTSGTDAQQQAVVDAGNLGAVAMAGSSFVLRGSIGYDRQITPGSGFVVGIEADALYTNLQRARTTAFTANGSDIEVAARQTLDVLGTVRGRLGYAFGPVLVYGTGGFAYGDVVASGYTTVSNAQYAGLYDGGRIHGLQTGYVYGGGVELMAPPEMVPSLLSAGRLSFKVEYLRYDLGQRNVAIVGLGPVFGPGGPQALGHTADSLARTQGQLVSAGLNYRFSGWGN